MGNKVDLKSGLKKLALKFKEKKSFRIICIALAALIVASGGLTAFIAAKTGTNEAKRVYAAVTRGTVTNVIEGTGTVEAISQYEITSLAKGDVIADYFEVGDYVTKDQLLYEIDSASMDKSITRQRSSVEKAQTNYTEALEDVFNLSVKSTINGVISNMYVSVGDSVQQGAKIADVIDKDTLKITLPFGKFDAQNIQAGSSASVTLSRSLTTIPGTVTKVASGAYVNSYGVEVTDVEIEFANPGTVSEGESASAVVGGYACYDTGEVSYIASKTITAKTSGEVELMYKGKGDAVRNGEALVLLESSSAARSKRDAQLSLQDANLSLDDLYDSLEDYSIKSPIDGKVIQKNIKAGEKLDSNSSTAMAIVADLSKLTFDISIDELDISEISVGQEVTITADALPNQTFYGVVSNISIVGSAYQGVTSYPVTVTIDNTEESDLIPGMNVSAEIIVDSAEDVLMVPVSAIHMGNLVIVKDDGTFADPAEMMKKNAGRQNVRAEAESGNPVSTGEAKAPADNAPKAPADGKSPVDNAPKVPADDKAQADSAPKTPQASSKPDGSFEDKAAERMKSMIENLDVPQGYTVVMVETGLTDGTYIEVKELDGSLKEGDEIVLAAVSASTNENTMNAMPGGMGGGMPGGMGGGIPSGGMPGVMGGNRQGMGANRQGMGANRQGMR